MKRMISWIRLWSSFFIMSCILLYGQTVQAANIMEEKEQYTNLVLVVDCSSSMQSSDSDWMVPESLAFLVNACPTNKNIRFSLILYGTATEIVFRDMPMEEESRKELAGKIRREIQQREYNMGQTDTGAALMQAKEILESKEGQNNSVVLITDGSILANKKGRTTEASRQEVLEFASYAQDNDCNIDVIALPRKADTRDERQKIREDLNELVRKTGGNYYDLDSIEKVSELLLKFLEKALDVKEFEPEKSSVSGTSLMADGVQNAGQGDYLTCVLPVDTQLVSSVTLIVNFGKTGQEDILLRAPDGSWYGVTEDAVETNGLHPAPGAYSVSGDGYEVIHLERSGFEEWEGEWLLCFLGSGESMELTAFAVYDARLVLEMDPEELFVMETSKIGAYLVTADGIIIDDLNFTRKLRASIRIINMANNSVEDNGTADREETETADGLILQGYEFLYDFTPKRASDYRIEVTLQTDTFEKTAVSEILTVEDQLSIVSYLEPLVFHKNDEVTAIAYLVTRENRKIIDREYYELSGMYAVVTNLTTQTVQRVRLQSDEEGSGVLGTFVPDEEGKYQAIVYTDSARETLQRQGNEVTFEIQDRKPYLSSQIFSGPGIILKGVEYKQELGEIFVDDDNDILRYTVQCIQGDCTVGEQDGVLHYVGNETGRVAIEITAKDNYGNIVKWKLERQCMTVLEIALCCLAILVFIIIAAVIIRWGYCRLCIMNGMLEVEIILNPERQTTKHLKDFGVQQPQSVFREIYMGSSIISLADKKGGERLWKQEGFLKKRVYLLKGLLEQYRERYIATYGAGSEDAILLSLIGDKRCEAEFYLLPCKGDGRMTIHKGKSNMVLAEWENSYDDKAVRTVKKGEAVEMLIHVIGNSYAAVWLIRLTYY